MNLPSNLLNLKGRITQQYSVGVPIGVPTTRWFVLEHAKCEGQNLKFFARSGTPNSPGEVRR
jgi:hypothetical protein